MKLSATVLLLLPALSLAFSTVDATQTETVLNTKETVEQDVTEKEGGTNEKPRGKIVKENIGFLSLRDAMSSLSPFGATRGLVDDDFFLMPRLTDRMFPSVFSPMPLLREINRDVGDILRRSSPAYEISEDEKQFKLSVDLPGVRPEDCSVELENEGRVLHLHGGRKIETESGYSETHFDQRFTLGDNLDAESISANLADGMMVVTAPKLVLQEDKPRSIAITSKPHLLLEKKA